MDIHVDGEHLTLHVNPYFLRLTFPHRLVENDESSAQYDPSSGYLTIVLTKEVPGQHFKDLDLLARLLAPSTGEEGHIMDSSSSVQNQLEELSLHSGSTEKASRVFDYSRRAGRPLIEVISETAPQDLSVEPLAESFTPTPSEDLMKEREILLEGASCNWMMILQLSSHFQSRKE